MATESAPPVTNLEPGDTVASLRAKLEAVVGDDIAIVVVGGARALRSPVAARMLRRYAEEHQKRLLVVADDRATRDAARRENVEACSRADYERRFATAVATAPDMAESPRREARRDPSKGGGFGFIVKLALAAVAVAAVAGYFIAPSATVAVALSTKPVWETIEVTASVAATGIEVARRRIPAQRLNARFEGRGQLAAAAKEPITPTKATGEVYLVNLSGAALTLPKGTRMGTASGVLFRTLADVALPAQAQGTASVRVEAEKPGTEGNAPPMTIDRIWGGSFAGEIRIFNPLAMSGGKEEEKTVVTASDKDVLRAELVAEIRRQAARELQQRLGDKGYVYPETVSVRQLGETWESGGEGGRGQELRLLAEASGLAFEKADVQRLALDFLRRAYGQRLISSNVYAYPSEALAYDADQITFRLYTERREALAPDVGRLQSGLAGLSKEAAAAYLSRELALARPAGIELHPSWAERLPRFTWRIEITAAPAE